MPQRVKRISVRSLPLTRPSVKPFSRRQLAHLMANLRRLNRHRPAILVVLDALVAAELLR